MAKLTYTEEQILNAFDEPVNGVKRFFNETLPIRGENMDEPFIDKVHRDNMATKKKEEEKLGKKSKKEKETPVGEFDDEVETEDEPKEEKEDKDTTMSTKVRKVLNDLESKKDGYDFISMTDLDVGHKFKTGDYQSLLGLIADKKLVTARLDKSGKEDPEGGVPGSEIVFWLKGR